MAYKQINTVAPTFLVYPKRKSTGDATADMYLQFDLSQPIFNGESLSGNMASALCSYELIFANFDIREGNCILRKILVCVEKFEIASDNSDPLRIYCLCCEIRICVCMKSAQLK